MSITRIRQDYLTPETSTGAGGKGPAEYRFEMAGQKRLGKIGLRFGNAWISETNYISMASIQVSMITRISFKASRDFFGSSGPRVCALFKAS